MHNLEEDIDKVHANIIIYGSNFDLTLSNSRVEKINQCSEKAGKKAKRIAEDYHKGKITLSQMNRKLNQTLKKAFDFILGDGAYQKINKQTGSISEKMEIFIKLVPAIETKHKEELKIRLNKKDGGD